MVAALASSDERGNIARLLVSCPDRHGIVAAVSGFLFESDANILSSDQHSTDPEGGTFFMRMEFRVDGLQDRTTGARARVRRARRRPVRDGHGDSPTRASASASRSSPRATTTACSTCSGAGAAASSTRTSSRSSSNHPDHADDVRGFGVPFHHVPVAPGSRGRGGGTDARAPRRQGRPRRARALHADPVADRSSSGSVRRSSTSTTRSCRPSSAPTRTGERATAA